MILFACEECGQQLYFESTHCTRCASPLGYWVAGRSVSVVSPDEGDSGSVRVRYALRHPEARGQQFYRCKNSEEHDACNWLVPVESEAEYCASCSLTELIPDLSDSENKKAWLRLEAAKRRLLFTLYELGLPVESKLAEPERGLRFRFLKGTPAQPVVTGHDAGTITINTAEANAAYRENQRERLGEAYRTTLGHLRHEIGHYYFDRLVLDADHLQGFRRIFGDERADYQQAVQHHYSSGPPEDWHEEYISAYATMHPWEDWAETWAHYLHMVDTLQTARSYGLAVNHPSPDEPKPVKALRVDTGEFEALMEGFHVVSLALNGLNRSMGLPDAYPFAVSPRAREKLAFVHRVVSERG